MTPEFFREHIQPTLPSSPGVYRFLNGEGKVLYVGKAKDLRKRVSSYYMKKRYESARLKLLTRKAEKVECTVVTSEQDALLMENAMIKQYQPKYNIQLKDDKTYPFICIKKEPFPRVFLTRRLVKDGSEYLGPYTSVTRVRALLELVRDLFPLRTCKLDLQQEKIEAGKFKVCLEYHIGNCLGPCEGLQSEEDYEENIAQIRHILKGHTAQVLNHLKEQMQAQAEAYEFEKAETLKVKYEKLKSYQSKSLVVTPRIQDADVFAIADDADNSRAFVGYLKIVNGSIIRTKTVELKRKLDETKAELLAFAVEELTDQYQQEVKELIIPMDIDIPVEGIQVTVPQIGDKKKLIDLALKNALYKKNQKTEITEKQRKRADKTRVLEKLQKDFRLKELPRHIECFDNSNIQGSNPVASVVVFKNGKPSKDDYRHFNIKTVEGPNDFASMEEVVYRRYFRLVEEEEPLPQLIVIDGGKGQLSSAVSALDALGIRGKVAIVAIAKKLEEIYFPGDSLPLYVDKRSESLKLIQHLRNEAHRFAITFHRQKRSKAALQTSLTNIEGVGEKTTTLLLKAFKSEKKISQASLEELTEVVGKTRAKKVYAHYNPST